MRKLTLLIAVCCLYVFAGAQTMQEKLYYTGKIYGFVKYYHSEVSICNVNWDSVLLDGLPDVRAAANSTEFNDALMRMLNAAGPMAIASSPLPDTLPAELKYNRDWNFISSPTLRADVQAKLNEIKNNFLPHVGCWASYSLWTDPGPYSYLKFGPDSTMLNVNTTTSFPDIDQRLLMLYKYWNIMKYFNPYNYVSDKHWDTVLYHYGEPMANVTAAEPLFHLYEKMSAALDDAHVEGLTYSSFFQSLPGFYQPKIRLTYAEGRYVVVKSALSGIAPGDALVSVDGKTMTQWEDSLRAYISAGNPSVFRREIYNYVLGRKVNGTAETLAIENAAGVTNTFTVNCIWPGTDPNFFYYNTYVTDSLKEISWTVMNCDIGYVNMANVEIGQEAALYADLKDKSAIIIDLRHGAQGATYDMALLMLPASTHTASFTMPDINYPGTFYWDPQYIGVSNPDAYDGKVILLMDERTQSHGEWSCMTFEGLDNVVKVGSQTAAADGNISRVRMSQDLYGGFTSLGTFYANGDSTQRIGIVPDTVVYQTRESIRLGRDNVLEAAFLKAGCLDYTGTKNIAVEQASVYVYPNPANENVTIQLEHLQFADVSVTITDVAGRVMIEQPLKVAQTTMDISRLSRGMYLVNVQHEGQQYVTKLVKE